MTGAAIDLVLNGAPHATGAGTLGGLVGELGLAEAKVAAAVNGEFVPRAGWDRVLRPHDAVEIVAPMQGG